MISVAKKQYLPYPVTDDWRQDVKNELEKRGRGAQARLREFIESKGLKCSSGELSDALKIRGPVQTSPFVEPIHEFLGWPIPLPPTASRDAGELTHVYARMTPAQRDMLEEASSLLEHAPSDQARKALEALLKAFKAQED